MLAKSENNNGDFLSSEYEDVYKESAGSKYKLFKNSSLNKTDPYGLSNEYNVLGKSINEILVGYEEGKDYEITKNEYFYSYKFTKDIEDYVSDLCDANLAIYTDADNDTINIIEYHFKANSTLGNIMLPKIKAHLTRYYGIDPVYDYIDEYDIVDISMDEFERLLEDEIQSIYHVAWESEKGRAILTIENLHDESSDDWYVTFTEGIKD
jgi:hypothetical protein